MATKKATKKAPKSTAKKAKPAVKSETKNDGPKLYVAPPGPKINAAPTFPVVHAKCRRGSDKMSEGQSCGSLSAENMSSPGSPVVQFRCVKCKYVWRVPMGGTFHSPV